MDPGGLALLTSGVPDRQSTSPPTFCPAHPVVTNNHNCLTVALEERWVGEGSKGASYCQVGVGTKRGGGAAAGEGKWREV